MAIIGFIGLGSMSRPMAKNLIKAGYKLLVYDKFAKSDDLVSLGAERAVSNKDVAAKCEILITMLPNPSQVKEAILGSGGIAEGVKKGSIVVEMSSLPPETCLEIAAVLEEKNSFLIDAPVSGGESKAIEGTLEIFAGGDKAAFDKVKPILSGMGRLVMHVGGPGAGNIIKLVSQIIVAVNIAAVSEAFVLAAKAGLDPHLMLDSLKNGLAGSEVMNTKLPMILDGNFKAGLSVENHVQDLQYALDMAFNLEVPMPLTSSLMEIMQSIRIDRMAANDHSAIVRYYEKLAGIEVRK
jgi:2-hydroxy-3-oxopropionate reductase